MGADAPQLPSRTRAVLSLVVHELATNAFNHGALSTPEGHVTVAWARGCGRVDIAWSEAGGPVVRAPTRRGYGSVLSQRLVKALGDAFTVEFRPEGLTANISLSVA